MTPQADKAKAFQALHQGPGAFVMPNPWDAGTARILTGLGFPALATTSFGAANMLGRPDGGLSRADTLENCRTICDATALPVSADLENGFADDPRAAAETIPLAAETGLVGGSIEDYSGNPDKPIYDFEHAVERVQAAVEAARALPFPFVLTARAENHLHGRDDLDDTIRRLQAFEAVGADVLYAPAIRDLETIRTVASALSKPLNVVVGMVDPDLTVEQLGEAGVRRLSVGGALSRHALAAFINAAREMKDEGRFTFVRDMASVTELRGFFGADKR